MSYHGDWIAKRMSDLGIQDMSDAIEQIIKLRAEVERLTQEVEAEYKRCGCEVDPDSETGEPYAWCLYHRALKAERDSLRAKNKTLRDAIYSAIANVNPWTTHCDYRAEPDLQRAFKVMEAALTGKGAG
jgi:hypothetical protein